MSGSRAAASYNKRCTKQVPIRLNTKTDADIIEWLDNQPSKQGAIKELIRERIARG